MWDSMLEETEVVAIHISKYPVIEQLYAKLNSKLSQILRDSLLNFYTLMLKFQVHVVKYFDPARKGSRTVEGMNPVTADRNKKEMQAIEEARHRVDDNIILVDAEVTKLGIDNLKEGQEGQHEQLLAVKEGIKALSLDLEGGFSQAERHQQQRHKDLIEMWKGSLDEMKSNAEQERIQMELNYSSSVRSWLSEASPWDDHERARSQRQMGLGTWLIEDDDFKSWRTAGNSSLLWIYGFAGTGKTGLVCRVIEELTDEETSSESHRLAIFYCSNDKARTGRGDRFSRSDPEEALRSVVSQLSTARQDIAPIVAEKFETFGPSSDRPKTLDYVDCVEILVDISRTINITIVLDAFDECDQDKAPTLLRHLEQVIQQSPNVRVLISTRPFPAIEKHLTAGPSIEITKERNGRDVREFIERTLEDRIQNGKLLNGEIDSALRMSITNTLSTRAGNMFLYASLLLRQLCDENHTIDADSIRKKLDELPKNLTEIYNRIMEEIHDPKNSQRSCLLAQNAIKWLLRAQRSLDYEALLEAISPPERRADPDEVLRACRTLVILEGERIEFAHYSVREHVMRMEAYNPSQCNIVATQSCLRILNTYFGADAMIRSRLSESQIAFKDYALLYWPLHYEGIARSDLADHRNAINAMLRSLFLKDRGDRHTYEDWFRNVLEMAEPLVKDNYLASKLNSLRANPPSPLFAACVFGLEDLIGKFGKMLDGLNKCNEHGQNALCLAIENDKIEAVKALLSGRFPADLNSLNLKAVQQLIDWDAAKPPQFILYASALQCAAATGRLEIAEYLIKEGAHVDLVAGYFGSPLQAACRNGHTDVVELLLRNGAAPNNQGGFHGSYPSISISSLSTIWKDCT